MSLNHRLSAYMLASALSATTMSCANTTTAPSQKENTNSAEAVNDCPETKPCPEIDEVKTICKQAQKDTNISLYKIESDSQIKDLCKNRTYSYCNENASDCTHCKTDVCYLYQNNNTLVTLLPPYKGRDNNTHLGQAIALQDGKPVICSENFRTTATTPVTQPINSSTVKSFTPPVTNHQGGINDDNVLNLQIEHRAKDNAMNTDNETPDAGMKD